MAENTEKPETAAASESSNTITSPPTETVETKEEPLKVDVDLTVTVDDKHPDINLTSKNNIESSKPAEKVHSEKPNIRLDLYKLEYSAAIKRHDDIYKSMWTNFSYMAILAGGILTFGKEALPTEIIVSIACTPLIFWFWASYLPLDFYGKQAASRASDLETVLNEDYIKITENESKVLQQKGKLQLYKNFENRFPSEGQENRLEGNFIIWFFRCIKNLLCNFISTLLGIIKKPREKMRVIYSVSIFAIIIHIICLGFLILSIYKFNKGDYTNNEKETTEQKLESINKTLGEMRDSMKK